MKKWELVLGVVFALLFIFPFLLRYNHIYSPREEISSMSESICPIEYGELRCFYGKGIIPFYNPNREEVELLNLEIQRNSTKEIYELNEVIDSNKSYNMVLDRCTLPEKTKIEFECSGRTYRANLKKEETKKFEIREIGASPQILGKSFRAEQVTFKGSTNTGDDVVFRCTISGPAERVGLWVGCCRNKTSGSYARDYKWILDDKSMNYNSTSGFYEYEWKNNCSKGEIVGATCQAYDYSGLASNWGDSYPLFTVSKETYPEHPTPKDCEKLKTGVQNFCYADVAEISGNISYCEKIWDPDIKRFCIARGELDVDKCKYVEDEGLRNECIFSINLKKKWLGIK